MRTAIRFAEAKPHIHMADCAHSTPHRAHFAHDIFIACGSRQGSCDQDVSTKSVVDHSRASRLIRTRRCPNTTFHTTLHVFQIIRTFHLSVHNLTVTTQYHQIHEHEDCLVVWPHKVRLQVMGPTPSLRSAAQRCYFCSPCIKAVHVFVQHTLRVRTPRLYPCLRKWMRDRASEGWLHRCSCRRERSKCNHIIR